LLHETDLDRALESGSPDDLKAVSEWWAPGFNAREIDAHLARQLVERGATVTVHAAAGLGLTDHLTRMLDADPSLIDAKGGDACTPLHFARNVETARLLLDRGARIDARDEDHESTPVQWSIRDAPDVVRFLLDRGATPDIFLASALGDRDLAARLIEENPACVAYRTGLAPAYPPLGHNGRGGTIYQWTLAFNSYPHQIALLKGHTGVFDLLWAKSDDKTRLLVACVLGAPGRGPGDRRTSSRSRLDIALRGSRAASALLLGDQHELRRGEADARSEIPHRASGTQPRLHRASQRRVVGVRRSR
jgi:ankyrin repeat protein